MPPLLTRGCPPFMHTVFSPLARAVFALVLKPASPALHDLHHPLHWFRWNSGPVPPPALCSPLRFGRPHSLSLVSHPRYCVARVVAPSCAKGLQFTFNCSPFFSTGTGCTICPCDPLTCARVHALLMLFVLALAGNFPASKFPALRLLLALRIDNRLAIIGANINEQSQLGDRDSELAAVIRGAPTLRAHLLMQPQNPHSAAAEYMPRHRASSDLHCGGDYGASDRGRRASEAGNVALRCVA
jgi:hypothetical protein